MLTSLAAEIGAVWTAALLAGRLEIPSPAERDKQIDAKLAWMRRRTHGHHAHGTLVGGPFDIHNINEMLGDLGTDVGPLVRALQWVVPVNPRSYRSIIANAIRC